MPGIATLNKNLKKEVAKQKNREKKAQLDRSNILTGKIDEYLEEREKKEAEREHSINVFYPSNLGKDCDRLLYLNYWGLLPYDSLNPKVSRIFDNGHSVESRFFRYFLEMRIFKDREIRVIFTDPYIRGRADFLIKLSDKLYLVELKTINDRGFSKLDEAKKEHFIQLQIYLNILNIDSGFVLYENKNNQDIREFLIEKDTEVWDNIKKRCNKIIKMTEVPKLPKLHDKYCPCNIYKKK